MKLQRKIYAHLSAPAGPYVHAVKSNGLLFLSGLTAFGSAAQQGSIAEQATVILDQVTKIAGSENTDLSSLIKVTIFVTDMHDIATLRAALSSAYGSNLPASSLVQVAKLFSPDLLIEIEAILAL